MADRGTVLTNGPFKGRKLPEQPGDYLLLPVGPLETNRPRPLDASDTNPHRLIPIDLFGRHFSVWVPLEVPDDHLAEYILMQLMNPLGLGLWREGEPINGRAEQKEWVNDTGEEPHREQQPNRPEQERHIHAYRPGRVPEAPGAGYHRSGAGAAAERPTGTYPVDVPHPAQDQGHGARW
jgi:hypothetical protein